MESLQTCVTLAAALLSLSLVLHTIAPPKENAMLDITHAIGVEKLDREEREVIHMAGYPLIHSCISLIPVFI